MKWNNAAALPHAAKRNSKRSDSGLKRLYGALAASVIFLFTLALTISAAKTIENYETDKQRNQIYDFLSSAEDRMVSEVAKIHSAIYLAASSIQQHHQQPDLKQRFQSLSYLVLQNNPSVLSLDLAPEGQIWAVYPQISSNAIGHDTSDTLSSREARRLRKAVMGGPYALYAGGTGLVLSQPIFVSDTTNTLPATPVDGERFWGYINAIMRFGDSKMLSGLDILANDTINYSLYCGNVIAKHVYNNSGDPVENGLKRSFTVDGLNCELRAESRTQLQTPISALFIFLCGLVTATLMSFWAWQQSTAKRQLELLVAQKTKALQDSELQFRELSERSLTGIFIIVHGRFTYTNPTMCDTLGYSADELFAIKDLSELIHHQDYLRIQEWLNDPATVEARDNQRDPQHLHQRVRCFNKAGVTKHLEFYCVTTEYRGETAIFGSMLDVTSQVAAERKITYQAYYDQLTGMPNRASFQQRIKQSIAATSGHKQLALMFIDLDKFKTINDSLGHDYGDQLLRLAASRLKTSLRSDDFIARIGGDEFSILIEDYQDKQQVEQIAQRAINAFKEHFTLKGKNFYIGLSIGICLYPNDGENAETLLKNADISMYLAKSSGGSSYKFFDESESHLFYSKLDLENELRNALDQGGLHLEFQPQNSLVSGDIIGTEALVRWYHPVKGRIPPVEFIPVAEESSLILELDRYVLDRGCKQLAQWQQKGINIKLAINISSAQLEKGDLLGLVSACLDTYQIQPEWLELEITENSLIKSPTEVAVILSGLQEMGVSIAIDDFGTGYSSFAMLKDLPINKIKLDKTFIDAIETDAKDRKIINTIGELARSLQLQLIAEGVETNSQVMRLLECGCYQGQGFLFARPMSASDYEEMLAHSHIID
ncbi:PAS domain S-box-containing protein/diguanylate cyclase (GGDEF) domain-containing protein [Ferrimonas sediminum]|uniref:PAS domain S-box-containing protein/diguanylate cyclase (GGDEF) domain-containing protein n=1 Tax=Ferrimonas sediminum TaxID=718193 RepID=A0A1G8YG10_9GAMM|nr:EAL domain-containing protein [Ferrimonas sediminum]SDK01869.1 PAS domain S-box-containing protein/diguanylate cyclase (GGDEF) domain-containing protein [Ferrimonas sediminum]